MARLKEIEEGLGLDFYSPRAKKPDFVMYHDLYYPIIDECGNGSPSRNIDRNQYMSWRIWYK